jgi:hypothetical protein
MLIIHHLPPLFKTVCCASRPVSSPVPCRNRFAVLVVAMRKLCTARHAMMAPAGGAKVPPSETIETSVVYSAAFWTRRTSRISSLDFSPRCFTGSFRAVDSRIVVSSWRWGSRISSALGAGQILPEDFLVNHDLISVFQVGWTVLHTRVSMYAAEQLIQVLTDLRNDDRQIQAGLDALRIEMGRHWRRSAVACSQRAGGDCAPRQPAWATLLGLIDECPVIHAAIGASRGVRTRAVSASAFEFISENRQIASVQEFMESLPKTLRC